MKQLIRKILKEETKDYKLVEKGIDVVVSMLNKDYPFVVGWKKNGDWEESTYYLYIDLVVDYKKAKESIEQGMIIYKEFYPENHMRMANSLAKLGSIYFKIGDYHKARDLLEKSIEPGHL